MNHLHLLDRILCLDPNTRAVPASHFFHKRLKLMPIRGPRSTAHIPYILFNVRFLRPCLYYLPSRHVLQAMFK